MSRSAKRIRIFLVEDHLIFRNTVRAILNQQSDMEVCGEADCVPVAQEWIMRLEPDLAIVDFRLKDSNGLDLIRDLRIRQPKLCLIITTMHSEGIVIEAALKAGAHGHIGKEQGIEALLMGIRQVMQGNALVRE